MGEDTRTLIGAIGLIALFVLVMWLTYDPVVSTADGESKVYEGTTSCQHTDYCYTCAPGIGGRTCGFKISALCSGEQPAKLRSTPVYNLLKSGRTDTIERIEVLEILGACK